MRSGSVRYVPAIDGLRAVAVLLVFAAHTVPGFVAGRVGVDVFFVISGYLICTILLNEQRVRGHIGLRGFYLRRLVRLAPPLLVLVAVHVALTPVWSSHGVPAERLGLVWLAALTYSWNLLLVTVGPVVGIQGSLSHLWSLAQEEQFYLLLPLVLLAVGRWARRPHRLLLWLLGTGALAGAVLYAVTAPTLLSEFSPLTRGTGLLAGCALAVVLHARPSWSVPAGAAAGAIGVLLLVVWGCTTRRLPEPLDIPVAVVTATVVVGHLATTRAGIVWRLLSGWALVRLGLVSYAFYLWHLPCVVVVRDVLGQGSWVTAAVASGVSLVLAVATLVFVEVPARRLNERWRTAPAVTAGPRREPGASAAPPCPVGQPDRQEPAPRA